MNQHFWKQRKLKSEREFDVEDKLNKARLTLLFSS